MLKTRLTNKAFIFLPLFLVNVTKTITQCSAVCAWILSLFFSTLIGVHAAENMQLSSSSPKSALATHTQSEGMPLEVGAAQFDKYLARLAHKRVSIVVNHSAQVNQEHLLDALIARHVDVVSIMSPEHGFRGNRGAGEKVNHSLDAKTGIPIHSLYGATKKPSTAMLQGVDIIVFDIQDVGVRFYTYLSTLHYVLEAAAEAQIPVIVLDRPNPNGAYVDGPVLQPEFSSFVGMHPIPVLHGMTLGELALMIKGEGWIAEAEDLNLFVVPVAHYNKTIPYSLPLAPSPNLPNDTAIALYPSLCFFEGTAVSIGRGTSFPFQLIGHPTVPLGKERIKVIANASALHPKHEGKTLNGSFLSRDTVSGEGVNIELLRRTAMQFEQNETVFFTRPDFFDKLAGNETLRKDLTAGIKTSAQIRESWQADLTKFRLRRRAYLLYPHSDNGRH